MSHFRSVPHGIEIRLGPEERVFLGDVLPLLADVGAGGSDPAADRLHVPIYLDDPEANDEWWRLMGSDLDAARHSDRRVFERVLREDPPVVLDVDDANGFLRVLNEARLVLGARFGIEVESDHDGLSEESRQVMDYLGWVHEELTVELMRGL